MMKLSATYFSLVQISQGVKLGNSGNFFEFPHLKPASMYFSIENVVMLNTLIHNCHGSPKIGS